MDCGLPTTKDMPGALLERLGEHDGSRQLFRFVWAGLQFQAAADGGADDVDIEDLFNSVQALAGRHKSNIAPFVAGWHPFIERLERAGQRGYWNRPERRLAAELSKALDRHVASIARGMSSAYDFERFTELIVALIEPSSARFSSLAVAMVQALRDVLRLKDESKLDYFDPIFEVAQQQDRLAVATLNYDLVIETASSRRKVPLATGIEEWSEEGRLEFGKAPVKLLKLHGSIDWEEQLEYPGDSPVLPQQRVKKVASPTLASPALIFGAGNKLRADGPYLDLLRDFQLELDQADHLACVGYSFRDDHVNAVVRSWFNADLGRHITVVDPSWEKKRSPFAEQLLNYGRKRLALVVDSARGGLAVALNVPPK